MLSKQQETSESSAYEGKQGKIRSLKTPPIEVFQNIYIDRSYRIDLEIPEFTAVCPKTSLPDFGRIYISYRPKEWCIELKSLKEYFLFFRSLGIFQENVANKVRDDLVKACNPLWIRVLVDYNTRGGIHSKVSSVYQIAEG